MPRFTPDQWRQHLRASAEPLPDPAEPLGLDDLAIPFRAAVLGVEAGATPATFTERRGEVGLWWARVDAGVDVQALLGSRRTGPLLAQDAYRAIEVWTDAELSALHVLWWLAHEHQRDDWATRVVDVRNWHLVHTQPDNATGRPWALHVFALAQTPECEHYAATLLHNCLAQGGRPDPLSAWILADAARAIDAAMA